MRQNVAWPLEFLVIFRGQTHWSVFLSQCFTKKQPAHTETRYLNEEDLFIGLFLEECGLLCLHLNPLQNHRQLTLQDKQIIT